MTTTVHATCAAPECVRRPRARGLCNMHYHRMARLGTLDRPTAADRFWSKVERTDTCWLWTGGVIPAGDGYGSFYDGEQSVLAHRFAYELLVGPIPPGLVLDHLCRVTLCVRPDHLEPVTQDENNRRGVSPSALNGRKTHCVRGHEFTPDNTGRDARGRRCLACHRDRERQRRTASLGATA